MGYKSPIKFEADMKAKREASLFIKGKSTLRGAVSCGCCSEPLTSGWSKGKQKKYAYHRCHNRKCDAYGKGIPRKKIEGEFNELLTSVQPTAELGIMASAMFRHIWMILSGQTDDLKKSIKDKIAETDRDIDKLVDMATSASNPRVIKAYEKKIVDAEELKLGYEEKLRNPGRSEHSFDKLFEHALQFISKPYKIWDTGRLDLRKIVLRLVFTSHLPYCRENGFLNTNLSLPFKALTGDLGVCLENGARGEKKFELSDAQQIEELFDKLEDWNHQLEHSEFKEFLAEAPFDEPQP